MNDNEKNEIVVHIGERFGEERALYGVDKLYIENCRFEGEEDGESALKECGEITAKDCFFDLRYPFWHDNCVLIENGEMTENCRAALWYSNNITVRNSKLHGIKAMRECNAISLVDTDIISPEFGWSAKGIGFRDCSATSEYFLMRAENVRANRLNFKGKYSFQYVKNVTIENSNLDTKDAFWHGKNITVVNSVVKGEYLAWYSKNLTFINCEIIGTQPFCYCKNLKLVDCVMKDTNLAFERSEVRATVKSKIDSVKNPYKGVIIAPEVGEIIMDDEKAKGKILLDPSLLPSKNK